MPLPLTVSCFSKIQIGFTFLVLAHLGSPGKGPLNGCVCVCVYKSDASCTCGHCCFHGLTQFNGETTPNMVPLAHPAQVSIPNRMSIRSAVSLQLTIFSLYSYNGAGHAPKNCHFPRNPGQQLIYSSLGPPEFTTQTDSRLVHLFL